MWKCLSRGLKGKFFEKNGDKVWNVPTTKVTQKSKRNCILRPAPVIIEHLNRYYGFYKSCCGGGDGNDGSKEKHHKEGKAKRRFSFDCLQFVWLDTLRAGSAFIVGLYLMQCFSHRRITYSPDLETDSKSTYCLGSYLPNLIAYPVHHILPEVNASKHKSDAPSSSNAADNIDKVLTENTKKLEEAHDVVLGALNNWLGTECMRSGKHKKAVNYFKQAAESNNSAGLFNLGICHEMGLGTTQDFRMAAELYQRASDLGHATAMFNLGVFHAHGWGGVEQNPDKAKELFKAAANLGQVDARKLLHMDVTESVEKLEENADLTKYSSQVQTEPERSEPSTSSGRRRTASARETLNYGKSNGFKNNHFKVEPKTTDDIVLWHQTLGISMENNQVDRTVFKKIEQLSSVDSGVLDLSSEDLGDIFV